MMIEGEDTAETNAWRSWPKYHAGHHMPFAGCGTWNARRRIEPRDESHFERTDLAAVRTEWRRRERGAKADPVLFPFIIHPSHCSTIATDRRQQMDKEALDETNAFIASLTM
jgi:hypothetical protein